MPYLILVVAVALLAGCAIDPKQREARETAHLRELARVCEKIGYAAGSDKNKECVVKLLAAEMAPPAMMTTPYPPLPTLCRAVGSTVICTP